MKYVRMFLILLGLLFALNSYSNLPAEKDTKCKCINGVETEVPRNMCVDLRIPFGKAANEPDIDLKAYFHIYTLKPSPTVFTSQGLQYHNLLSNKINKVYYNSRFLTSHYESLDNGVYRLYYTDTAGNVYESDEVQELPSNITKSVNIFTENRELLEFRFQQNESSAKLSGRQSNLNYVMVMRDKDENPVTDIPYFYDLYIDNGNCIRYSALDRNVIKIITPSGREIIKSSPFVNLQMIEDDAGAIRQVYSGVDGLADIVTTDSGKKYEIRIYSSNQIGSKINGLYTVTGTAHTIWTIENPTPGQNTRVKITKTANGISETYSYIYNHSVEDWMLTYPNELAVVSKSTSWDYSNTVKSSTVTEKTPDGKIAFKQTDITQKFSFGEKLVTEILDPDGLNLRNQFTYHENGQLASKNNYDGFWETYTYDSNGRKISTISAWKNAPFRSPAHMAREVKLSYTPHVPQDTILPFDNRPRCILNSIEGKLTSKKFFAYYFSNNSYHEVEETALTENSEWGNSTNLRTRHIYYPTTADLVSRGRLNKIIYYNGIIENYTYQAGNWIQGSTPSTSSFAEGNGGALKISKSISTENFPDGIAYKTYKDVVTYDERGNKVKEEQYVYTGTNYDLLSWKLYVYNSRNQQTHIYYSDGTTETYTWNCCNKESYTDREGIQYTYVYDSLNRLVSERKLGTDGNQELVTTYEYDAKGNKTKETISIGNEIFIKFYEYNHAGLLTKEIDSTGLTTTYQYIAGKNSGSQTSGLRTIQTFSNGTQKIFSTYCDKQIESITGNAQVPKYFKYNILPDGIYERIVYNGSDNSSMYHKQYKDGLERIVKEINSSYQNNSETQYFYNNKGQNWKVSKTGEYNTINYYDEFGTIYMSGKDVNGNDQLDENSNEPISITETIIEKIDNVYYLTSKNRVLLDNDGENYTENITRNRLNNLASDIASEIIEVDSLGNSKTQITKIEPEFKKTTIETTYSDSECKEILTSINGHITSIRSKNNILSLFEYDPIGRLRASVDPRTGRTEYQYHQEGIGAKGKLSAIKYPDGNSTTFFYAQDSGKESYYVNSLGKKKYLLFNNYGKLTHSWGDIDSPVQIVYNNMGWPTQIKTFRNGNWNSSTWPSSNNNSADVTYFTYDDASGLVITKSTSQGEIVSYEYDSNKRLIKRLVNRHENTPITTQYEYDNRWGRLSKITYSDDTPSVSYTFNRANQLIKVSDALGERNFTYDAQGNIINEEISGLYSKSIGYTYNSIGKCSQITLDSNSFANYSFDSYGRLSKIEIANDEILLSRLINSNLLERIERKTPRVTTTVQYEPHKDLVKQIANGNVSQYLYLRDSLGRITSKEYSGEAFGKNGSINYNYDARSSLLAATSADSTLQYSYSYDQMENITSMESNGAQTYFNVNNLNQYSSIITNDKTLELQYTNDGLMTNYDGWLYQWDGENRLIQANKGELQINYQYDYKSRRIRKQVRENNIIIKDHCYVYDLEDHLIEILDKNNLNSSISRFVWNISGDGNAIPFLLTDCNSGKNYYYVWDASKNITQLVDQNGNIVSQYLYSPFGEPILQSGEIAHFNPFKFSCEFYDEETGLIYFGYRYYNPKIGKWLSPDPNGYYDSYNLYSYVKNRIPNFYDFQGLQSAEASSGSFGGQKSFGPITGSVSVNFSRSYTRTTCPDCSEVDDETLKVEGSLSASATATSSNLPPGKANIGMYRIEGQAFYGLRATVSGTGTLSGQSTTDKCNNRGHKGKVCGSVSVSGSIDGGFSIEVTIKKRATGGWRVFYQGELGMYLRGTISISGEYCIDLETGEGGPFTVCATVSASLHFGYFLFHGSISLGSTSNCVEF